MSPSDAVCQLHGQSVAPRLQTGSITLIFLDNAAIKSGTSAAAKVKGDVPRLLPLTVQAIPLTICQSLQICKGRSVLHQMINLLRIHLNLIPERISPERRPCGLLYGQCKPLHTVHRIGNRLPPGRIPRRDPQGQPDRACAEGGQKAQNNQPTASFHGSYLLSNHNRSFPL